MSGSVNKVILIGNVGRDPEFTQSQDGRRFARISLATSERWRDKGSGERREQTEWHRIVVFNENLVDVVERFVKKGSRIYVEGQLQTRKWQDQSGQDRYSTEIVLGRFRGEITLLDIKDDAGGERPRPARAHDREGNRTTAYSGASPADLDDDIPF